MPLPQDDIYTSEDYWSLPDGRRAELIDSVLYDMALPGRVHQRLVSGIHGELYGHIKRAGGLCEVYPAPFVVNLAGDDSTWVEPDVSVVCDPSKLSDRGCEGAPDLVVEVVSPSSRRMDYLVKAGRYEQVGVREYWIVDPDVASTLVYRFEREKFGPASVPFSEPVPVGIFDGALSITMAELL